MTVPRLDGWLGGRERVKNPQWTGRWFCSSSKFPHFQHELFRKSNDKQLTSKGEMEEGKEGNKDGKERKRQVERKSQKQSAGISHQLLIRKGNPTQTSRAMNSAHAGRIADP